MNLQKLFRTLNVFTDDFETAKPKPYKAEPTIENIVHQIYLKSSEKSGPWIAGGMGRQIAIGENNFSDIDVWFRDQFQLNSLKERLYDIFGDSMYETYASDNATTYMVGKHKVQFIKRKWYPSLQAIFDDFDFTCCQVAVNDDLTAYGPGVEDAKNYVLKVNRFDEKAFLARYAKYVGYGYVMNPDEFIEIIENRTLNYDFDGSVFGY